MGESVLNDDIAGDIKSENDSGDVMDYIPKQTLRGLVKVISNGGLNGGH